MQWKVQTYYNLLGGGIALVYATDAPGERPIHGRFIGGIQADQPTSWRADGSWGGVPEERKNHPLNLTLQGG